MRTEGFKFLNTFTFVRAIGNNKTKADYDLKLNSIMSSHHIIRENQEAALIIANGLECSEEILHSLLEWSPYVLVLDGALDRFIDYRVKFDAVLGDFDSINTSRNKVEQEQNANWIYADDQSKTDLEKGFEHLVDLGHEKVNVLWGTGKRLDHTWNNLISMAKYNDQIQVCMVDDYSRCFILPNTYKKYYKQGAKLSIMPITDSKEVKTKGLKYNLNQEILSPTLRTSSSNEVLENGFVEIEYDSGILALIESKD